MHSRKSFPASMKSLRPAVRDKAIDIANALIGKGYPERRATPIAIAQAETWARNRGKEPKGGNTRDQHVVPHVDGWAVHVENGKRASRVFDAKNEALDWAKGVAANQRVKLVVHGSDGKIQKVHSFVGSVRN